MDLINTVKLPDTKSTTTTTTVASRYINSLVRNYSLRKKLGQNIQFKITLPELKCLGIYLTKEIKNLYSEHYKRLTKETTKDTRRRKNTSCTDIGRTNIVKVSVRPKYNKNAIPIKIAMSYSTDLEKTRIYMESQRTTK